MRSLITCILHKMLLRDQLKEDEMGETCSMHILVDKLGDLVVDGRECDGAVWIQPSYGRV